MSDGIHSFRPGDRLQFDYLNHRDTRERRDVIFQALDYGSPWGYPKRQWFMRCHDLVRNAPRSFAVERIDGDAVVVGPSTAPKPLPIRDILETMFRGWILHEQSYEQRTESHQEATRSPEDAMAEACGGDAVAGELLTLFGNWANDIESIAAHYGLALARRQPDGSLLHNDGTVDTLLAGGVTEIVYIDPAPSPMHYWHKGAWQAPEAKPDVSTPKEIE